MAVARVAWHQLADKEKAHSAKLVKAHPHHNVYLAAARPEGVASELEIEN